jgi:hypothetical protein
MDLATWLITTRTDILSDAHAGLSRATPPHYREDGTRSTLGRLSDLFDTMVSCVQDRDLSRMTAVIDELAQERYSHGFAIAEVQTAINTLEEATWRRLVEARRTDGDVAADLAAISTVLGVAKDRLAQVYVALAAQGHAPTIDLTALAAGTAS